MKHLPIMALILAMPVLLPAQSDPINNSPINNQTLFNLYEPVITPAALAGARSTCNVNSCLGPNLVPNPGFEQVTSCPTSYAMLSLLQSWFNPSTSSPDVFNACSTPTAVGVPTNSIGHQAAHGGNGYAGFASYSISPPTFREYISVRLTSPLEVDSTYYIELWVSAPDDRIKYASNNIGVYFSANAISSSTQNIFNVTPQFLCNTIITDTAAWFRICGEYTATSNFSYLTIGNFYDNTNTQVTLLNSSATLAYAYYYIDDVLVAKEGNSTLAVNLGDDTSFCSGPLVLNAVTNGPASFTWSTGAVTQSILINAPGTYWVNASDGVCTGADTIYVDSTAILSLNLGNDTAVCSGTPFLLNATVSGAVSYLWSTGAQTPVISPALPGVYWVNVSAGSCHASDTIHIDSTGMVSLNLGNDTSVCSGTPFLLNATVSGAVSYLWSTGAQTPVISAALPGVYWVNVSAGSCQASDTIQIDSLTLVAFNLGNDTSVCSPAIVILNPAVASATYEWQDGLGTPTYVVQQSGVYAVTVTLNGCSGIDTIAVNVNPVAQVSISATSTLICANDSTQICASGGTGTYLWNNSATSTCITISLAGNYYLTVTDNNGCTAESNHLAITVHPLPPVSISVNGDTLIAYGAASYQWILDGSPISGATTTTYIATGPGLYSVAVTDTNGCASTSLPVNITGTGNLTEDNFFVYPNPSSDRIFIVSDEDLTEMKIYDTNGKLLQWSERPDGKMVDISTLAKGIYLAEIKTRTGVFRKRWVKAY